MNRLLTGATKSIVARCFCNTWLRILPSNTTKGVSQLNIGSSSSRGKWPILMAAGYSWVFLVTEPHDVSRLVWLTVFLTFLSRKTQSSSIVVRMYVICPYGLLSNVDMVLAKSDMEVGVYYSQLLSDPEGQVYLPKTFAQRQCTQRLPLTI